MNGRFGVTVVVAVLATVLLMTATPVASAAVWYIADPTEYDVGYVSRISATKYVVKKNSGAKAGVVVKTTSGWKVMRGTSRLAVVKANGTKAYPVNMYRGSSRIGRCGLTRAGDWRRLERCAGTSKFTVGLAPRACPTVAAMGAARLLLW